ncbi:ROK family protein, partial [bacterium]|nr:ROK family protein [bacterium]
MSEKNLCIDGGGTWFRYALVGGPAGQLELEDRERQSSPKNFSELKTQIESAIKGSDCEGVAFAIAGPVTKHESMKDVANIPFLSHQNLKKWVEEEIKKPCVVINDMEAALAGEVEKGVLQGCEWAIFDTLSTGWGGALLLNGIEVPGEPGHINVDFDLDFVCGCTRVGCNEARYAGGPVGRRVRRIMAQRGTPISDDVDAGQFLTEETTKGTDWAVQLYREVGEGIGRAWANVLNRIPLIEKIVYMGSFGVYGMPFMKETMVNTIRR